MSKKHMKHHHPSLNTLVLVTQFICKFGSHIICGLSLYLYVFKTAKSNTKALFLFLKMGTAVSRFSAASAELNVLTNVIYVLSYISSEKSLSCNSMRAAVDRQR